MKKFLYTLLLLCPVTTYLHAQNVGIGLTKPASKLSVNGSIGVGSSYDTIAAPANGAIVQGNVGIGSSAPLFRLHVMFTSGTDGMTLQNTSGGAAGTVNLYFATYRDLTTGVCHPDARISAVDDGIYSAYLTFSTRIPGSDANALTERMRLSDYGVLGIGTTTPSSGPNTTVGLDIRDAAGTQSDIQQVVAGQSGGAGYAAHTFVKQRGTLTSPSSAISGDNIGILQAQIYTSGGYHPAADIYFQVDTVLTTDAPGSIHFGTTPRGAIAPLDRMIIKNSGYVGIGTDTPTQMLHVAGTTRTTNLQMTAGAVNGYILRSDASGNASWASPSSIYTATANSLSLAGNTLTSTVNGVIATSPAISSVSNISAANALSTTVNGVTGSTVQIINSNTLSLSGTSVTSSVNGVASNALDLSSLGNNIYNGDGTLTGNRTVSMGTDNLNLNATSGTLTMTAATSINNNANNATNINTGTSTGAVNIANGTTAGTVNMGASNTMTITNGNVGINSLSPTNAFEIGGFSSALDQSQTNSSYVFNSGSDFGQSFTAGITGSLTGFLWYFTGSSGPYAITYSLYTGLGSGGAITGTSTLLATTVVSYPSGTGSGIITVAFGTPPTVTAGTMYAMRIQFSGLSGPNFLGNTNVYAGGTLQQLGNPLSANDMYFQTYVTNPAKTFVVHTSTGQITASTLSGSGSRIVSADASGNLTATLSAASLVSANALSLSGTSLTSTVNGLASNSLDLSSIGNNIYNGDGSLTGNRTMTMGADNLTLNSTTGNLIFNPSSTGRLGIGITNPYQTVTIQYPSGLATGLEGAPHCLGLLTGTTTGTDYILYMGADKTNGVSYLQSVRWGTAVANLSLNARGGNVGIGTPSPGYILTIAGSGNVFGVDNSSTFASRNATGSYENYLWPRWSDNVMYLNYGSAGFSIRNNSSTSTMFMSNAGYVGMGTTSPQAPLDIEESISTTIPTIGGNRSYFESNFTSLTHDNGGASGTISILASGWIMTYSGFMSASDARIKNVIGASDAAEDLKTLNKIKITDYTMRDKVMNGDAISKKVIAQQVREVYPTAVNVSQQAKYVPNIYHIANSFEVNGSLLMLHMDTLIREDKDIHTGSQIRCYLSEKANPGSQKEIKGTIESINDGAITIRTADALDAAKYNAVYAYGTEVNDFLTVDYDAISMLNVSATQELSSQLKDAQAQIVTLKQENEKANTQNNQLRSDVDILKASVETLQQIMNAKAEK